MTNLEFVDAMISRYGRDRAIPNNVMTIGELSDLLHELNDEPVVALSDDTSMSIDVSCINSTSNL